MKAIVNVPVCAMYAKPTRESTIVDEVLYGMVVEILDEVMPGWLQIRTHYRYEGIVCDEDLLLDDEAVELWESRQKKLILNKNFCDILSEPKVQGWIRETLPLGSLVSPVGEAEDGWQEVMLCDGRTGYVKSCILGEYHSEPVSQDEETLRKALVEAAMRYRNTHYRWGGKSTHGIDCSGLCSMAYMLCGILIYRDANLVEGFPMHSIEMENMKPGDLLFFPGHVAMYLGENRYCHSTARSSGFAINSLNPEDDDYREDLHHKITGIGSYFEHKEGKEMKVFLSADMEGTCGIVSWPETERSAAFDYVPYQKQMSAEVAAACRGALTAGAEEVLVKDAHDSARNIDPAMLPRCIRMNRSWSGDLLSMMSGLDQEKFDAVFFTGYHAWAGCPGNALSHTMNGRNNQVWLNGVLCSEFLINTYTAGYFGVPVAMVTGDQAICDFAKELIPAITTVPVNVGRGGGVTSLHPAEAVERIEAAAQEAVKHAADCVVPMPDHFHMEIDFVKHHVAYSKHFYPGAYLKDNKIVCFDSDDWYEMLRFCHFVLSNA